MMKAFRQTIVRNTTRTERIVLPLLALPFAASVLLFLLRYVPSIPKEIAELPRTIVLSLAGASILSVFAGVTAFTSPRRLRLWILKALLTALPGSIIAVGFWIFLENTPESVRALSSLFFFALAVALSASLTGRIRPLIHAPKTVEPTFREWVSRQGPAYLLAVLGLTVVFFGFSVNGLGKFVAVDEPLWLYGRIPKYWTAIQRLDPYGTNISDKPGVTVALSSGIGMLRYPEPKIWKTVTGSRNGIEEFFAAFRLPIVLVATIFLPLFYYLPERLAGRRKALLAYAFIALAPPTIGMTGIINPDSLLWVFAPLSLIAFLVHRKREHAGFLLLSGVLLGLALLTKYVANILFVFVFGLIFLEYLLRRKETRFLPFLRRLLAGYAVWTATAISIFFVLFPAVWVKPYKLLDATILSQAFGTVSPLFAALLIAILADSVFFQARFSEHIMRFFRRHRHVIVAGISTFFLALLTLTVLNTWTGMRWSDFPSLLASPKTIASATGIFGAFAANAYPLLFGVMPLSFAMLFAAPLSVLKKDPIGTFSGRMIIYGILFILLYYLGTAINGVGAMTRYQIILFPIAGIVSGFGLDSLLNILTKRVAVPERLKTILYPAAFAAIVIPGIVTLAKTPFPLSYASSLLPSPYVTDVKDMGPGSYEAATWLNALPNADALRVWSDKDGVCKLFDGSCENGFDWNEYAAMGGFDYVVVSSGRESRTTSRVLDAIGHGKENVVRFDGYYGRPDPDWELLINGRPSHYVRIYRLEAE